MSQAEDLLMTLASDMTEEHITIDSNRVITVPESLRKIAVQYDHNMRTVTFDCPRYWDERDLSEMSISVNYLRPDRSTGSVVVENITVDSSDDTIIHFDWTIKKHVAMISGQLSFLICAKKNEADGTEQNHWNSELNQQMSISAGLEVNEVNEDVEVLYPAVIQEILLRLDTLEVNDNNELNLPSGGTTGQYLKKNTDTDGDAIWVDMEHPIHYIESVINDQPKINFRSLESGHYIINGYFEPYPDSSLSIACDNSLIHVYRANAGTHVICLDPLNAKIVFFEIMVDESNEKGFTYTRKIVSLLDLETIDNKVTTIDDAATDDQYPTAKAVKTLVDNAPTILTDTSTGTKYSLTVTDGKLIMSEVTE